jgi:hypothetical protein
MACFCASLNVRRLLRARHTDVAQRHRQVVNGQIGLSASAKPRPNVKEKVPGLATEDFSLFLKEREL